MVSPLKLWKHPQPKRLWPALSGLSVLAHIGILGVSLPYVVDLMQSESAATAAAAIPIELAAVSAQKDSVDSAARSAPVSESSLPDPAKPSAPEPDSLPAAPPQNTAPAARPPVPNEPTVSTTLRNPPTQSERRQTPSDAEETAKSSEPTPPQQPSSAGSAQAEEKPDSQTDSGADIGSSPESPSPESPSPETPSNEPSELPTVPGDQTLPLPGEESTNSEGNTPQSAFLSIVSFSEAPNQQDVGKTPPRPREGSISSGVVLDPAAKGCPRLTFSREQWIYRVLVDTNGQVERATIWTQMVSRPMSDEESAIACLIENAGFAFEPALFDGEPILDDNLLLTISIIEAP